MERGRKMNRRQVLAGALLAPGLAKPAAASMPSGAAPDLFHGTALYADVETYAAMGEHRSGGAADTASTAWMGDRLRASGFTITTPGFDLDLFDPVTCHLEVDGSRIAAFPAWPPVATDGVQKPLKPSSADGSLVGAIALVVLPYRPGAAFVVRGYGSAVQEAEARGAAAIVVVTGGPTGEIVALNAHLERFAWRVPVILVAGREAARLGQFASEGRTVKVVNRGLRTQNVHATNMMATRAATPGADGQTVVLTTPKSGWFRCAGERGSGIAIFLALAAHIARHTPRRILAVATSGHELEGLGGEALLKTHAPPPEETAVWAHIGANVASNAVRLENGVVERSAAVHPQRGILVPEQWMPAAAAAFAGQPGYDTPVDLLSDRAVGEVVLFRRDGYRRLTGIVGGHPLHHTRLDLPANVTSPAALEPVARAMAAFLLPLTR